MKISSVLLLVFLFLVPNFIGCSSNKSNPVVPVNEDKGLDLPLTQQDKTASRHQILGAFTATFDIETLAASVEPNRTLNAHHNVTGMIPDPVITINSWDPIEEIIDVDIQLHNPTWTSVYDVRLIIFTDTAGHKLINDDNWTPLWDIPGGQIANPFKAYAKHESNRAFTGLLWLQENFKIKCPDSNFSVQFVVDASYPGNCDEPYEISNFHQTLLERDIGSEATLHVDIFDWQGELSDVVISAPQITGDAFTSFEYDSGNTWSAQIVNNNGAGLGWYKCFVKATSLNPPGISIYDLVTIHVKEKQGWVASGGGAFFDQAYACTLDQAGNVYVTGMAGWDNNPTPKAIFLYKYSNDGVFQWGHIFYCDDYAVGNSLVCDNSNNVYITGYLNDTIDFDPGPGLLELTPINSDAYLCKYDPDGNLIWGVNWGGNDRVFSNDIAFNGEDELILACRKHCDISVNYFNLDGDTTGNILLEGDGCNFPYGIAIDSSDSIYVTGNYSETLDFDAGPGEDIHEGYCNDDMFLFKYDSSRQFQWAQTWGSTSYDYALDVDTDSQGNAFVTGGFGDRCDFDPGPGTDERIPGGTEDIFLVKYDSDSTYNWVLTWGDTVNGFEQGRCVCVDSNDNIYATGNFAGINVDLDPGPGEDLRGSIRGSELFLSKFNTDGDYQWTLTLESPRGNTTQAAVCDPNNNVYISGNFRLEIDFDPGPDDEIRYTNGSSDPFVAKYNSNGSWD